MHTRTRGGYTSLAANCKQFTLNWDPQKETQSPTPFSIPNSNMYRLIRKFACLQSSSMNSGAQQKQQLVHERRAALLSRLDTGYTPYTYSPTLSCKMRFNSTKKLCQESLDSLLETPITSGGGGSRRLICGDGRPGPGPGLGPGLLKGLLGGPASTLGTLPLPLATLPLKPRLEGLATGAPVPGLGPGPGAPTLSATIVLMNLPLAVDTLGLPMLPPLLSLAELSEPRPSPSSAGLPDRCTDCSEGVGVGQLLLEPVAEPAADSDAEPTAGEAAAVGVGAERVLQAGRVLDLVIEATGVSLSGTEFCRSSDWVFRNWSVPLVAGRVCWLGGGGGGGAFFFLWPGGGGTSRIQI